jgi:hypothetical protein
VINVVAQIAVEVDRRSENPRPFPCDRELASPVRGSSVTAHCHAATALLTREYQSDHRRHSLHPAAFCVSTSLDNSFHIRESDVTKAASFSRMVTRRFLHGNGCYRGCGGWRSCAVPMGFGFRNRYSSVCLSLATSMRFSSGYSR